MELRKYFEKYHDEETCIEELRDKRLQNGLSCRKCAHNQHSFRRVDLKFQCKKCGSRMSLRSGTVMEKDPDASVFVPVVVPFTRILAPLRGFPFSSVTFPATFFSCAFAANGVKIIAVNTGASRSNRSVNFAFIKALVWF